MITDAIKRVIELRRIDYEQPLCVGGSKPALESSDLTALSDRAETELAAIGKKMVVKDDLLYRIPRYLRTFRKDRPVYEPGDVEEVMGHWQTEDWLDGLIELAEECEAVLVSTSTNKGDPK